MAMKAAFSMDLDKALRIAVLLDHHRTDCAELANNSEKGTPTYNKWESQAQEARQLREELLKAITKQPGPGAD